MIDTEALVRFIARESERESIFLTPVPQQEINSYHLLDWISGASGITKEQIGTWCLDETNK